MTENERLWLQYEYDCEAFDRAQPGHWVRDAWIPWDRGAMGRFAAERYRQVPERARRDGPARKFAMRHPADAIADLLGLPRLERPAE